MQTTETRANRAELARKIIALKKARDVAAGVAMRSLSPAMFEQYEKKANRLSAKIWRLEFELGRLS